MSVRQPSYRLHKARNGAVVTIAGHDHYLGAFNSPESWEKYHRLVAEWLANRAKKPISSPKAGDANLTINHLILAYWKHAESYYVKNGDATSEQHAIRSALSFVRRLYGSTPAADFSPSGLKAVRQAMIEHKITRKARVRNPLTKQVSEEVRILHHGLCRRVINKHVGRIKRMFAWAVEPLA